MPPGPRRGDGRGIMGELIATRTRNGDGMDKLGSSIQEFWQSFMGMAPRLGLALLILLASLLVGRHLGRLLAAALRRTGLANLQLHERFFRVLITLLCVFVGIMLALNVLGLEKVAVSMLAGGGVTAVVLGFAFREIGENLLAGLFLAFSRPFNVGDTIATGDIEGKVKDIELRYTHIRTDDGRDAYVPSSQLFNSPVINFTRDGLRRFSFTVGIDYANDAAAACDFLKQSIEKVDGVLADPAPGVFIGELDTGCVVLKAWYWVDVFNTDHSLSGIRTRVMDDCRQALLERHYTVSSETVSNIALVKVATPSS